MHITVVWSMLLVELVTWSEIGSEIIEDDILLRDKSFQRVVKTQSASAPIETRFWNRGRVPVHIDFPKGSDVYNLIRTTLENVTRQTECITFPERTTETDYVNITRIGRAEVGYKGGQQIIDIGEQCESAGIILHEVLHTLGLWHEHSRSDRDRYVNIQWSNIIAGEDTNFKIRKGNKDMEKDNPYDLLSIMHYKYNQFSKLQELPTILPRKPYDVMVKKEDLGQRIALTNRDIQKLKWMYKRCSRHDYPKLTSTTDETDYGVGEGVKFECDDGYNIVGARSSTCLRNGRWTGALPICVDSSFFKKKFIKDLVYVDVDVYQLYISSTSRWQRHQGGPLSAEYGPFGDHTNDAATQNSTGAFYYFNARGLPEKTTVKIYAPFIYILKGPLSILFFYSMYGTGTGSLNVTIYEYVGWSSPDVTTWTISGSTPDRGWYCSHIPMENTGNHRHYLIEFAAISGHNDAAIIAIDDILIGPSQIVDEFAELQGCGTDKPDEHDSISGLGEPGMKYT